MLTLVTVTHRNQCINETRELQSLIDIPFFTTAMGKSVVNEELKNYGGVYSGAGTHKEIKAAIEGTDCALWLGRYSSDFNTAEFTMAIADDLVIDVQRFYTQVEGEKVLVKMKHLLPALVAEFKNKHVVNSSAVTWDPYPLRNLPATGELTQDFLWATLGKFFQSGDVIIGETGTSAFGLGDSFMPAGSFFFNQTIWGSIGYATGSIVGVCQAVKESSGKWKRGILVTGEGSFHLTAQAVADMLRYDLKPVMSVLILPLQQWHKVC
jgi:pyruvate decarboxylase